MTTWAKLESGAWGLRGLESVLQPGASVMVLKKDGTTTAVVVGQIVKGPFNGGVVLATVAGGKETRQRGGCSCGDNDCCSPRCRCMSHCVCRGGNVHDC